MKEARTGGPHPSRAMDPTTGERRTSRRSFLMPTVYLVALAVVLAGCSSSSTGAKKSESPTARSESPAARGGSVVLDDPAVDEVGVAVSADYFAWSSNSETSPDQWNTYVRPVGGGEATKLNPNGTQSDNFGIDGSTVVYEVFNGSNDDLKMYDAATQTQSGLPQIDTQLHEYQPTLSGDWLLFTRSKPDQWQKVILFNLSTGEQRTLAQAPLPSTILRAGQVNGDWVTFEHCHDRWASGGTYSNCNVFRYQISTGDLVTIPNPGLQQFEGGVSQDGTVYLTSTGGADMAECGADAQIIRYPVGGPGVVIATFDAGFEPELKRATDESDGSTTLYFVRTDCSSSRNGIYSIANADTAT